MKSSVLNKLMLAVLCVFCCFSLVGCASMMPKVPLASPELDAQMKTFPTPEEGKAGVYIYRDSVFGGVLLDQISVDDTAVGALSVNTYIYKEVDAGPVAISVPTEFARYTFDLETESGQNYFVHYYMRMGVFRGNGAFERVDPDVAIKKILECKLVE